MAGGDGALGGGSGAEKTSESTLRTLRQLRRRREFYVSELNATHALISADDRVGNVEQFLSRCETINSLREDFRRIQMEIIEANEDASTADRLSVMTVARDFDAMYFQIKGLERTLSRIMHQAQVEKQNESLATSIAPNPLKLKSIEIPNWDGNQDQFSNWFSLYNSLVHEAEYSRTVKLTYLRLYLTGPPLNLIENLPLTDANYDIAYKLIKDQYASQRTQATHCLKKLFEFAPLSGDSIPELQSFLSVFRTNMDAFKNLEIPEPYDFVMFTWALRCLPPRMRNLFDQIRAHEPSLPTFAELTDFVRQQCAIKSQGAQLDSKSSSAKSNTSNSNKSSQPKKKSLVQNALMVTPENSFTSPSSTSTPKLCSLCCEKHLLYKCQTFRALPVTHRQKFVIAHKLCTRCLNEHALDSCIFKGRCGTCRSSQHNELLHDSSSNASQKNSKEQQSAKGSPGASSASAVPSTAASSAIMPTAPTQAQSSTTQNAPSTLLTGTTPLVSPQPTVVVLGTAQGFMQARNSAWIPVRFVIDPGSMVDLISSDLVQRLGLKVHPSGISLTGALQSPIGTPRGTVHCCLSSRRPNVDPINLEALVVPKVCSQLPMVTLPVSVYTHYAHLDLADRAFHISGKIDFLLGASHYLSLFQPGYAIHHGEPSAVQTTFGWVIMGVSPSVPDSASEDVHLTGLICGLTLDETVQKFWETEEVKPIQHMDPSHALVEKHFADTHRQSASGKYVVRLPFDSTKVSIPFGNSRELAIKRWFNMERKLKREPEFQKAYHRFLEEYLRLGHMIPATEPGKCFIPHFAISRPSSLSSPIRVVFDASCKDSSGLSLNDRLHTGPPLQKDITEVVQLFRMNAIGITTDVKNYYRQIWVDGDDCAYQHIFWRKSVNEPLQEYRLLTVTYGTRPAPFLAQRTMIQLASDYGQKYPLAVKALLQSCYMDDIVCSVSDYEEAVQLRTELTEILSLAGFELRKWASNNQAILQDLPEDHRADLLQLRADHPTTLHILGVQWNPRSDVFTYRIEPPEPANTKRSILSRVASIFDPLGWAAPVVFYAKVFLRELWMSELGWDTPVSEDHAIRWAAFAAQLPALQDIAIPRFCVSSSATSHQLIGFCDASEAGFAATIYLRSVGSDGVKVELLKAKTRVAPLKTLTVQRLELNGAVLLSELLESVGYLSKQIEIDDIHLYTDSATVLAWLKTPPHKMKIYTANRVVKILESTQLSQWHHIPSALNAADCASRGLSPQELVDHSLWWHGPSFLKDDPNDWPHSGKVLPPISALAEFKTVEKVNLHMAAPTDSKKSTLLSLVDKYSTLQRAQRVLAWILRFIANTRPSLKKGHSGTLKVGELDSARQVVVRLTQGYYFKSELKEISRGRPCSKKLRKLLPFIDEHGILRVGGRLQQSLLPETTKHPIILPKEAKISSLICDFYHIQMLHSGPQAVQATIQREYWILSVRSLLRQRIWRCGICAKVRGKMLHPVMADLPHARVTPSRPFNVASVDMAGPLYIKESTRRNARVVKAYFAVFVCLSTKAAHLELVGNLSTESYRGALDRFVARRGLCHTIHCDNGTNFQGAAREDKEIRDFLLASEPDLQDYLAARAIRYAFNPPNAPWMGGLWEAAVKSTKRLLTKITVNKSLTFEEMATLLCRVEAVLNSRPLCKTTSHPQDDPIVLTPGHFLIGAPLLSPLENHLDDTPDNHLSRWQAVQKASQQFWRQWSREYLHTLNVRPKWSTPRAPLAVGDPVYLISENTPPLAWPLAIIEDLLPGSDGIARKARVRTSKGTYLRPVAKLVSLPPADQPPNDD